MKNLLCIRNHGRKGGFVIPVLLWVLFFLEVIRRIAGVCLEDVRETIDVYVTRRFGGDADKHPSQAGIPNRKERRHGFCFFLKSFGVSPVYAL